MSGLPLWVILFGKYLKKGADSISHHRPGVVQWRDWLSHDEIHLGVCFQN
jgi:hypothetical protein